jgi:hypothetical protein
VKFCEVLKVFCEVLLIFVKFAEKEIFDVLLQYLGGWAINNLAMSQQEAKPKIGPFFRSHKEIGDLQLMNPKMVRLNAFH